MIAPRMIPLVAALWLLGGCLLGGGHPDALYRFGAPGPIASDVAPDAAAPSGRLQIALDRVTFAPEVAADRLLAVHGANVRYIKGMRWVAGAQGLFESCLQRGFATHAPPIRLWSRSGGGNATRALVIDVSRFEVQYADDTMVAAPTVVIEGDATLTALTDRRISLTHHFVVRAVADQNRGAAIAVAFDTATALATSQIADWAQSATGPHPGV